MKAEWMKRQEFVMREAKHINNWHIQDRQLIYDGHDSEVNDRWHGLGGSLKYWR